MNSFRLISLLSVFIDDITITRVDENTPLSTPKAFTEYVTAKRDEDGNIIEEDDKDKILSLIGAPGAITFSTDSAKENVFATRKDIKNVTSGAGVGQDGSKGYSVIIEFNDDLLMNKIIDNI